MGNKRYKRAQRDDKAGYVDESYLVPVGHSMCIAGYLDCPERNPQHYHCGNCGGISGHQGHYSKKPGQTDWQFNCPEMEEA